MNLDRRFNAEKAVEIVPRRVATIEIHTLFHASLRDANTSPTLPGFEKPI
jgi:hypothetical protein